MGLLDRTMPKTEEGDEKDKIRLVEKRTDEKNGSSYLYTFKLRWSECDIGIKYFRKIILKLDGVGPVDNRPSTD